MHSLEDLLHPVSTRQVRAAGDGRKGAILTRADFGRLPGQGSPGNSPHLWFIRSHFAISPDEYCPAVAACHDVDQGFSVPAPQDPALQHPALRARWPRADAKQPGAAQRL